MRQKRVCVIGAGIAGLVTAKVLIEDGFSVTVFDKSPAIGGVWEDSRTYPGLRANNSHFTYCFSDFPYPPGTDEFPTASQIRSYLNRYADHFGLRQFLRLSTSVRMVSRAAAGLGFNVTFQPLPTAPGHPTPPPETAHFDFVAVCNGVFSEPAVPPIEGAESFSGQILHSSRLRSPEQLAGKHVIVVGAAKSGLDCAALAAKHARSTTLLFRRAHWMMPRHLPNGARGEQVFFNRFFAAFTTYHRQSRLHRWLHTAGAPVVRAFWRLQGKMLLKQARVPPHMTPATPLPAGLVFSGAGTDFFDALHSGSLIARQGSVRRLCGGFALEIQSAPSPAGGQAPLHTEQLPADVVILATGWKQPLDFLSPDLQHAVRPGLHFRLFRRILPPSVPGLGFIGYASSIACQLNSEIAAHWLSEHFLGRLSLPSVAEMETEVDRVQRWTDNALPGRSDGFFIGGYLIQYIDELLDDMRLPRRRLRNPLREFFGCLTPERWRDVSVERRQRHKN